MTNPKITECDLCGTPVKVVGHTTKHYKPLTQSELQEKLEQATAREAVMVGVFEYIISKSPKDGERSACIFCDMGGSGYSSKGDNHHDDIRDICPINQAEQALTNISPASQTMLHLIQKVRNFCNTSDECDLEYDELLRALTKLDKLLGKE